MSLQNVGTYDGGIFDGANFGLTAKSSGPINTTDAAIANGRTLLISELEKRDTKIRQPLTSTTYFRDIPLIVGEGSWVDVISSLEVDYGLTGGSESGPVSASNANDAPVIQMKLGESVYKAHQFRTYIRIGIIDAQRSNYIGRPLDQMLTNGVRLAYDKHMDANAYIGIQKYGSTGLVNNPNVIKSGVVSGNGGNTTWQQKTPEEILRDINKAITDVWEASANDLRALPNHLVIPHQQFSYIATTQLSPHADKTILSFLQENNISKVNGGNLVIGSTAWCKNAGAGNTDRMVVYVHDDEFLKIEELAGLSRLMTQPNITTATFDTLFAANISELQILYKETIQYFDGI